MLRPGRGDADAARRDRRARPILEHLEERRVLTNLLPGFSETIVATGLNEPTAMAEAPDGRIFICEQGGNLRVGPEWDAAVAAICIAQRRFDQRARPSGCRPRPKLREQWIRLSVLHRARIAGS